MSQCFGFMVNAEHAHWADHQMAHVFLQDVDYNTEITGVVLEYKT